MQHVRNNKKQENGSNELIGHAQALNPESVTTYGIDRPSRNGLSLYSLLNMFRLNIFVQNPDKNNFLKSEKLSHENLTCMTIHHYSYHSVGRTSMVLIGWLVT